MHSFESSNKHITAMMELHVHSKVGLKGSEATGSTFVLILDWMCLKPSFSHKVSRTPSYAVIMGTIGRPTPYFRPTLVHSTWWWWFILFREDNFSATMILFAD